MGIKDWLAKGAGPSAFGTAFGASVVDSGMVIGRTLYVGHGTRPPSTHEGESIYENSETMRANLFSLYTEPGVDPPPEDHSKLSKDCKTAGIAFATHLTIAVASSNFNDQAHKSVFNRSMGASSKDKLLQTNSGITPEMLLHYTQLRPPNNPMVLNLEMPGSGDMLGALINEVSRQTHNRDVAFPRTGQHGFGPIIEQLAEETISKIRAAIAQYGW